MNADTGEVFAAGTVILVTFDYREHKTISVPDEWREKISKFEGLNALEKQ
jgi:acyl-CoA thioesterase FadM